MTKEELIKDHNIEVFYRKHKVAIWVVCFLVVLVCSINW